MLQTIILLWLACVLDLFFFLGITYYLNIYFIYVEFVGNSCKDSCYRHVFNC
jgi:hypothetical protein